MESNGSERNKQLLQDNLLEPPAVQQMRNLPDRVDEVNVENGGGVDVPIEPGQQERGPGDHDSRGSDCTKTARNIAEWFVTVLALIYLGVKIGGEFIELYSTFACLRPRNNYTSVIDKLSAESSRNNCHSAVALKILFCLFCILLECFEAWDWQWDFKNTLNLEANFAKIRAVLYYFLQWIRWVVLSVLFFAGHDFLYIICMFVTWVLLWVLEEKDAAPANKKKGYIEVFKNICCTTSAENADVHEMQNLQPMAVQII